MQHGSMLRAPGARHAYGGLIIGQGQGRGSRQVIFNYNSGSSRISGVLTDVTGMSSGMHGCFLHQTGMHGFFLH